MGDEQKDLVPVEQKEVHFYGDELTAVRADDGHIYVSVSHMCQALGIDRASQVRRIGRNEVMADGYQRCVVLTHHRGRQQIGVLRVDLVPMWLTGISINAVKEDVRDKLRRFQREAAKLLWEAFQEGRLTADPVFDDLLQQDTPEAQAYKMIQGMLQLARNQLLMRAQIQDHEDRLERVEAMLDAPDHAITEAQATQISQAVKAVAMAFSKQSGRNEYGGVYGELYRRYEVNSYKLLPASKFDDAMGWLNEWLQSLGGDVEF